MAADLTYYHILSLRYGRQVQSYLKIFLINQQRLAKEIFMFLQSSDLMNYYYIINI